MKEAQRPTFVFFATIPTIFCGLMCALSSILVLEPDLPKADALFKVYVAAGVSAFIGTVGAWWGKPYAFGGGGLMAAILALLADSRAWSFEGKWFLFTTRISAVSAVLLLIAIATTYKQVEAYGEARVNPAKRWP